MQLKVKPKIAVVMPAFNAARTLRKTWEDLPHDIVDHVILVDDNSTDDTVDIARQLGLQIFVHDRNYGYGANQKTCYSLALQTNAAVIVMVHPDYQYDPTLLPKIVKPLIDDSADIVFGSRLLASDPMAAGMPWWKYWANRFLTKLENVVFGLNLSEYHTGYRAYNRKALEAVNYQMNSDAFVFDQEIVAQFVVLGLRITEVPVPTRYFPQASSASVLQSVRYGLEILVVLLRYILHAGHIARHRPFESLSNRYRDVTDDAPKS
ncbi:MAG: glycosyltransferase family 2 protein [Bryobacterales bacterium]|nr:glycosyltransferase family 2 protein [Bryobacterales bacterium]